MRLRWTSSAEMREVALARGNLAGLFDPVFAKRALKLVDDRSHHAQAGVAPVLFVLRVTAPFAGDSEAADEADPAVDHRDLSMVAIIEPPEIAEAQGMELAKLHSGVFHQRLQLVVHLVA